MVDPFRGAFSDYRRATLGRPNPELQKGDAQSSGAEIGGCVGDG